MHLNDIESKLAYFEYILSDYFAILIFFEFDFGQPETVFGFIQVCTRMTFRFNRLNSTGFISSLKIGMKKMKFWARKRGLEFWVRKKDILEYLENSHHT